MINHCTISGMHKLAYVFSSTSEDWLGPDGLSRCGPEGCVRSSRLKVSYFLRFLHFTIPTLHLFPCKCTLLLCLFSSIFPWVKAILKHEHYLTFSLLSYSWLRMGHGAEEVLIAYLQTCFLLERFLN